MYFSNGLEDVSVVETDISYVDGEKGLLIFRGIPVTELVHAYSFEETAFLLWHGYLPNASELKTFQQQLVRNRPIPLYVKKVIDSLPDDVDMVSALLTGISALGDNDFRWPLTFEQAISIIAKIPTIVAYRYNRLLGNEPVAPRIDLGHTANYLYMLRNTMPSDSHIRVLEAYLVLMQENGMNPSTFTGRIVASTRSDFISCFIAALGALKGPLHGGAPLKIIEMLESIGEGENAQAWLHNAIDSGNRIMGFGHRIYKTSDPRANFLREIAVEFSEDELWMKLALHVEEVALKLFQQHNMERLKTNVEFYAAAIMKVISLEPELFTPTFAISRAVGWSIHFINASRGRLIYPQSTYTGKIPRYDEKK